MSHVETLLARLDGVRSRGSDRWMCKCPAHNDRSPSMSVRLAPDGTVLIHCFFGCEPNDILAAVGMNIRDLFPKPLAHHLKPKRAGVSAFDVMSAMRWEVLVIELLAEDMARGVETDTKFRQRAQLAADRINTALALCDG